MKKKLVLAVVCVLCSSLSAFAQLASRVTVTTTATLLFSGVSQNQTVLKNTGTQDIFIGDATVTTTTGWTLNPNEVIGFSLRRPQVFYGIVASGTAVVQKLSNISSITQFFRSPGNTNTTLIGDVISSLTSADTPKIVVNLTNTVQTVFGGPSVFNMYFCANPNAAWTYVQVYNSTGTPTVGTTVPDLFLPLPPGDSAANLPLANVGLGIGFKVAATTGPTNATAPVSPVNCTFTVHP